VTFPIVNFQQQHFTWTKSTAS